MNETAMRLRFQHRLCGTEVEGVMRTVITQPSDMGWPRDDSIRVPFCPKCKGLVTVGELEPVQKELKHER